MTLRTILSFFTLFCSLAQAADYYSPRTTALAGAGHAGPLLNDSILLNPSYIAFLPTYSFAGSFTRITNGQHGRNYHLSVQDGNNEYAQAGLGYTKREDVSIVHVAVAKSLLSKQIAFGLGAKYWYNSDQTRKDIDLNLSMTTIFNAWVQSALVINNLIRTQKTYNELNLRRELVLASKINLSNILMVYLDPHWIFGLSSKPSFSSGLELALFQDFFLRGGYQRQVMLPWLGDYGNAWGAGFGWIAPKISLDYGYGRSRTPVRATSHVFGATIYF